MGTATYPVIAGALSSMVFMISGIPALTKAWRTKEMHSYSRTSLIIATVGNALHWLYIISLPLGPIYMLHGFATVSTALMLGWCIRFQRVLPTKP